MERGSVFDIERAILFAFMAGAARGSACIGSVGEAPSLGKSGIKAVGGVAGAVQCRGECGGSFHEKRGVAASSREAPLKACMFPGRI